MFDHRLKLHPQFLKDQVKLEISCSLRSIPLMSILTVVMFLAEVRGYGKLFDSFDDTILGKWSIATYSISFILFTDSLIYWIHRALHSKLLYKRLHKTHHKWKIPTPFASHAFNPLDGFLQSLPYHLYVFILPMHKWTYLALFVFVNVWTVSIHDGNYRVPDSFKPVINGSAHHMDHHLFYNFNYGQFFTLWDRIGRSYRHPSSFEGTGPLDFVVEREQDMARKSVVGKQSENSQTKLYSSANTKLVDTDIRVGSESKKRD